MGKLRDAPLLDLRWDLENAYYCLCGGCAGHYSITIESLRARWRGWVILVRGCTLAVV